MWNTPPGAYYFDPVQYSGNLTDYPFYRRNKSSSSSSSSSSSISKLVDSQVEQTEHVTSQAQVVVVCDRSRKTRSEFAALQAFVDLISSNTTGFHVNELVLIDCVDMMMASKPLVSRHNQSINFKVRRLDVRFNKVCVVSQSTTIPISLFLKT